MEIRTVATRPIEGQKPGTSGLRAKTRVFMQPHYLENFVQSAFDALGGAAGRTLVLGGDGRFFAAEATQRILRLAVGNGATRVIVGAGGLLSTPAVSAIIRRRGADFGIILSASHNPGGPDGDFGVKVNVANGGPAPEKVTAAIHAATRRITSYRLAVLPELDLARLGEAHLGETVIEVVDPVEDWLALMRELFDFPALRRLFAGGLTMRFDAMNAVTGPYARRLFEGELGAPRGTVVNAEPLPDFGGLHPDPNPVHARALFDLMMRPDAPDFAAAADGDGDRNLILGRGAYVSPSDSLAIIAAHADLVPGYAGRLAGIARSMPTSRAADRVAAALGVPLHETPTGWKFFGSLLDAGLATICGEESFGTGSDHLREKDGLWAVLFWLSILAARGEPVAAIQRDHWRRFGRDFYSRHDYENLDPDAAGRLMEALRARLPALPGTRAAGLRVEAADDFRYVDPVDGSVAERQGVRIFLEDGARVVFRLSGTGTEGATLRVYLERHRRGPEGLEEEVQLALAPIIAAAEEIAGIARHTGRRRPDVVT